MQVPGLSWSSRNLEKLFFGEPGEKTLGARTNSKLHPQVCKFLEDYKQNLKIGEKLSCEKIYGVFPKINSFPDIFPPRNYNEYTGEEMYLICF